MSCLWCISYYFNQGFPLPRQTKRTSFQGLSFSDRYCKQKVQDMLLLYNNLIGINVYYYYYYYYLGIRQIKQTENLQCELIA